MKICLVSQEYPPETGWGGIGTQTHLKAQGLSARGHEIHVLSASWDRETRTSCDGQVTVHRIPTPELGLPLYETSTYWIAYSMSVAEKLHGLAQQVAFDVIQFPEYAAEGFIYQTDTFQYRTARYVVQMHGPLAMFAEYMDWPPMDSTFYRVGTFMEQSVLQHADLLLASSRNTAAFGARYYGCALDRIQVVYSSVDTERIRPRQQPPHERFPRVLFVGKLSEAKGISSLVHAILRLRTDYPNIGLRIIGPGDTKFLAHLEDLIEAHQAQANFEFKGYIPRDQLSEHYAWCDFFVGPSIHEPGPGNVFLEAMAHAKPVIACASGGTPEVVVDQETGLLIPPGDAQGLDNAIATLTENGDLRRRLGQGGRERVEKQFSFQKYIDRVENLYRQLLA